MNLFKKPKDNENQDFQGLRVENISHSYGRTPVLHSINFEAKQGEVCAILGPNGAGKTTLMKLITGYFLPVEGRIWLSNLEMTREPVRAKQLVGYLPEHFPVYNYLTVLEFLVWCLELRCFRGDKKTEVRRVLRTVGLADRENSRIGKLSKGMRQRVSLAQALLGDSPFLVLDEPTSGLDPHQIKEMRELIAGFKGKRTVVLSTHILAEASLVADRIIILSEGRVIASGKPGELASAYLEGEMVYRASIRGKDIEKIEKKLSEISSIMSYELVERHEDYFQWGLRIKPGTKEEEVLKALIRSRLRPFEFFRKELKLEDIFMKAVTEEVMA